MNRYTSNNNNITNTTTNNNNNRTCFSKWEYAVVEIGDKVLAILASVSEKVTEV
jgi:hypothetical protein